jgi:hypothetical protein
VSNKKCPPIAGATAKKSKGFLSSLNNNVLHVVTLILEPLQTNNEIQINSKITSFFPPTFTPPTNPTTTEYEIETIEGRTGGETPITNTAAPLPTPTLPDTPGALPVPPTLPLQALPPAQQK